MSSIRPNWILLIYPVSNGALRAKSCPLYFCPTALRIFFCGRRTLPAGILRPFSGFVVVLTGCCFHKVPTHSVLIVFQQNCSSSGICPVSFQYILRSRGRAQSSRPGCVVSLVFPDGFVFCFGCCLYFLVVTLFQRSVSAAGNIQILHKNQGIFPRCG